MMRLPVFLLLGLIVLGLSSCRSVRPEPEAPPLPTPEPPPETRPVERTMQGFKIQVFSTTDRDDAGAKEAEVLEWWQSLSPNQRPQGLQSDRNLVDRSEEHTSELQSRENLVCRLLLEKKKNK